MSIETFAEKFDTMRVVLALRTTAECASDVIEMMEWADVLTEAARLLRAECKDYVEANGATASGRPNEYYAMRPQSVCKAPHIDVILAACRSHQIPPSDVLNVDTSRIKNYVDLASLCEFTERKSFGLITLDAPSATATTDTEDVPY